MTSSLFKQRQLGTTLIELLVICAILMLIVVPIVILINPLKTIQRAHDEKRISDLLTLSQAIEQYVADNNNLPPDLNAVLRQSNVASGSGSIASSHGTGWIPVDLSKYIEKLPVDPVNSPPYVYRYYRSGYTYKLDAKLEYYTDKMANTSDGGDDNCHYELGSGENTITLSGSC